MSELEVNHKLKSKYYGEFKSNFTISRRSPGQLHSIKKNMIPVSINLHITERCNYQCKFCFAKYSYMQKELTKTQWRRIINNLIQNGCQKVNFAGGEPTLIPFLPELIQYVKKKGLFVSIISNGTGISKEFLNKCGKYLDLIGLSIESSIENTEKNLGRTLKNRKNFASYSHIEMIREKSNLIHSFKIPLKINTIVTPLNWQEDMHDLIRELKPIRWKVFQVHKLRGINDEFFEEFGELTNEQYYSFIEQHKDLNPQYETSDMMRDSYCMITPDGRFYQDTNNCHNYSDQILKIGMLKAFNQVNFSKDKFDQRNACYFQNFKNHIQEDVK
jgi:radical S-adenosyl methionine domain-containing protein 2